MTSVQRLLIIGVAALAIPGITEAQTPFRFDQEVVVTPTRLDEPVALVPASVTIITAENIAASPVADIPGVLRAHAGINVIDITGNRRSYRIDLRGFGETASLNTLVLVDGRRANQPDFSGIDWSQIPLDRVERIEITRGARGNVLYGDNATGGVINIITKDGRRPQTQVDLRGGSFGTFNPSVTTSGSRDRLSYSASVRYYDSDGHRTNSQSQARDVGATLGIEMNPAFDLGISTGYHSDDTGLPGALLESELMSGTLRAESTSPDDFADVDDYYVALAPKAILGEPVELHLDFSARNRDTRFFASFAGGMFTGDTSIRTIAFSPKIVVRTSTANPTSTLVAGLDVSDAKEDISNASEFFGQLTDSMFTLEKRNYGVYVHEEYRPRPNVAVSAGYRRDHVTYQFAPSTPGRKEFDVNLTTAGVTVEVRPDAQLFFSYARGFRYPVLDELFNFFANTISPDLLPQSSDDVQVGARLQLGDAARATVTLFHLDTEREIFLNPASFGNENLDGQSRRIGFETVVSGRAGQATLEGSYSFTDTLVRNGQYAGMQIPNVPRHRASVQTVVGVGAGVTVGIEGIFVGERFFESDYENTFGMVESYFLLNTRVKLTEERFTVFLDVSNLLDQEYAEYGVLFLGFPFQRAFLPSPGINASVGVSFTF